MRKIFITLLFLCSISINCFASNTSEIKSNPGENHFFWNPFAAIISANKSHTQFPVSLVNMPTPIETTPLPTVDVLGYLDGWRKHFELPAAVITISRPGEVPHTYLSGFVDLANKQPVHADSLFAIGSISKTFISGIILHLVAENKLKLDDPLTKWLPQYPNWRDISIRQLLNMTSGIVRYTEDTDFIQARNANPTQRWSAHQLVDIAYQHANYFPPGTKWQYSNTNYLILGLIIEKVAKQPLAWVLQRDLIQPLKLIHTYYISTSIPTALMPLMAHGYQQNKDVTQNDFSVYGASGSIVSNTLDLTLWIRALFTGFLPAQQLKDLTTVFHYNEPTQPPGSAYGLGIFALETPQYGTVWWYTGLIEGYSSLVIWIPNKNIAIAVAINRLANNNLMLLFPGQALFNFLMNYVGQG